MTLGKIIVVAYLAMSREYARAQVRDPCTLLVCGPPYQCFDTQLSADSRITFILTKYREYSD